MNENTKHLLKFDSIEWKNDTVCFLLILLRCVTDDSGYYVAIKMKPYRHVFGSFNCLSGPDSAG